MIPLQVNATPSLPSASDAAQQLASVAASKLVGVAETILPVVFAVLVLFWAINYALTKTVPGIAKHGGVGGVIEARQATRAEHQRRAKAEERFVRRVERNGWELHYDAHGGMYSVDPTTGRKRRCAYQVRNPDWDD